MNLVEQLSLPGLQESLGKVEVALRQAVAVDDHFMREVAGHLVRAGGKRLRPALVVASAAAAGRPITDEVIDGAVAVELVHLGSLYHDDVMDGAEQRRGVRSVNSQWGNLVAILAGDFLLARASEIAASLGTEVAALLAQTIGRLCQGEVSQLRQAFNPDRTEAEYFASIRGKTASLLATSARIGAIVSGADRAAVEAVTEFGLAFGIAFQIWDDIRDLVASDATLGKPAGHDLVEGTYTLPVLRALAQPEPGAELRGLLHRELDGPTRDKARDLIIGSDAITSTAAEARTWADRSAEALTPLLTCGSPPDVENLASLGHRLIDSLAYP
ncbi:MAG: polyprenyl synthetase family protein [Acidimicrobiaceae bacterium]|nr:polyprenyl synthetase family protein [Acidimicrobiaceae bacterium]